MPTDLDYFSEEKLNNGCWTSFANSLPHHLQQMFKIAVGKGLVGKSIGNVLQGYYGPDNNGDSGDSRYLGASNGLQEVKYRWGATKHMNWVPVYGWIVFGICRALGDTSWNSLYFDSKTGKCLGYNKESAASKLNEIGKLFFDNGKFSEAKEYFNNAYTHSSYTKNYDVYKSNRENAKAEIDAIKLNSEGDDLFNQGKYHEAHSKYHEAYDKSNVSRQSNIYSTNRDKAKAEIDAINLNSEGDDLLNQGKYHEAHSKYHEACDKSNVSRQYNIYSTNRDKAKAEIDAINLNSEGDDLLNQGKYHEAHSKYHEACDKSNVSRQYNIYSTNRDKAKAEIDAINLNSEGDDLLNQGKYHEAHSKYHEACDKSNVSRQYNIYSTNRDKAKAEIDAINLNSEGDDLLNQGKYHEAHNKYHEACDKSNVSRQYNIYSTNRDKAKAEIDAINLNSEGDDLLNQGKYHEAHSKYHEACDKSNVSRQYNIYSTNRDKAKAEIDAINLNSEGDDLLNQGKYHEAHSKYHEACDKSNVSRQYNIYSTNRDKAKAEIDAINLNSEGDDLLNQGKYHEAHSKYHEACDKSNVSRQYNIYSTNRDKAKAEIDAINLNSEGDDLLNQGKYHEAQSKYHEAYDKSNVSRQYNIYSTNRDKAKAEIDAINLNSEGDDLLNQGKYHEAHSKYHEACDKSNVSRQYNIYSTNRDKAKAEIDAINLNSEGDDLLNQGKYHEAHSKYHEACDKSNVRRQYNIYSTNRDKAKAEIDAINLNSEGDDLFNQGKYHEAHSKYHEACDKSNVSRQYNIYSINREKAKAEIDAINLNSKGDDLFNQGKYREAHSKYHEAYGKSQVNTHHHKYSTNRDKAKVELDALNAYQLGEILFNKRRYNDALKEYQAAHSSSQVINAKSIYNSGISKVKVEIIAEQLYEQGEVLYCTGKYVEAKIKYNEAVHTSKVNKDYYSSLGVVKAQTELDAVELNEQGNMLFVSGNFSEARDKYQQAYDISEVAKKSDGFFRKLLYSPHEYKSNIDKAQTELNAIALNDRADVLLSQGKFAEAIKKYQAAYDKTQVFNQRKQYKNNRDLIQAKVYNREGYKLLSEAKAERDFALKILRYKNAQEKFEKAINKRPSYHVYRNSLTKALAAIKMIEIYNSAFKDFSLMLTSDITDSELEELGHRLDSLLDAPEYGNDSTIVNRFHIVSLRISRKKLNSQLESINRKDINDLIEAIMNLIETEIEVLKELNIIDHKLEQELKSLEGQLNALDLNNECKKSNTDNILVNITSIASRVEEYYEEVENRALERLAQNAQQEHCGNTL
ncbi:hypothetical protein ABEB36_013846 [Hypothenemus hampei]|uniref:Uncharacterized protein n=1 Tax=Hypothenemus hampei TaxID=57062 RepID=A0ABD1E5T4_HYPHA